MSKLLLWDVALTEVNMNSCMFNVILFEFLAIAKLIDNIVLECKECTRKKTIVDDLFFWVLQGFAVTFIQLNDIIQLLGK